MTTKKKPITSPESVADVLKSKEANIFVLPYVIIKNAVLLAELY